MSFKAQFAYNHNEKFHDSGRVFSDLQQAQVFASAQADSELNISDYRVAETQQVPNAIAYLQDGFLQIAEVH